MTRGDTLVEVIITLFVISLGSMVATSLAINAIRSNASSKNNLVALNLAVEGIEAIRNIRDSNWLKFSFNKEACWNMRPEAASDDSCVDTSLIQPGYYSVDLHPQTMKWDLSPPYDYTDKLNLNNYMTGMEDKFRIAYVDLSGGTEPDLFLSKHSTVAPPAQM